MSVSLLIQMAGHGGSGKSTLARQIAARLGGVTLDLDVVKTALLDAGLDWDQASKASYETIFALVDDLLFAGTKCVVVDTPSYWADIHQRLGASAHRHLARHIFLECVAAEPVRADRLATRPAKRSQIRMLGVAPADAPQDAPPVHARQIATPTYGCSLTVATDSPVDLHALPAQITALDD
jgi:predicted kinase